MPRYPAERIHEWFSLSYANFLVMPRSLLQSMPEEWQQRFVACLDEFDEHWDGLPDGYMPSSYRVQPTEFGRLGSWKKFRLPHYNRGRTRVAQDGTATGEGLTR